MSRSNGQVTHPDILLLGGGYTLSRLARRLDSSRFVITTTSPEKRDAYRVAGWTSELLDLSHGDHLQQLLARYPEIQTIVDSVPPQVASGSSSSAGFGVDAIIHALKERVVPLKRLIYLSTTGVYGCEDGSPVDEQVKPSPVHAAARARLASEQAYQSLGCESIALRIPAIYGPGRGIGLALQRGTYRLIEGDRWTNRIHVEDLCTAIQHAIDFQGALPTCLNVSDDLPSLTRDVVEFYCSRFGLPVPPVISFAEAQATGHHTALSNQRILNAALKRTFGMILRYPSFREGAGVEFSAD